MKGAVLLAVFCLLLNVQVYSEAAPDKLVSGDLLLLHDKKIWLLSTSDLSETLLFDPQIAADDEISSDVIISPDRRYVYIVVSGKEPDKVNRLVRYDLSLKTLETIYESTELARITSVSPNGNRMLLSLVNFQVPSWSDCLLNIAEKSCQPIDLDGYDPNAVFWLSDHKIITVNIDGVVTYELDPTTNPQQNLFKVDVRSVGMFFPPDDRFYAGMDTEQSYEVQLMSIRSDLSDFVVIPHTPIQDSAIGRVAVSQDGTLLAYQQALRLTVIDLGTGELIKQFEEVQRFEWPPEGNKIVMTKVVKRSEFLSLIDLVTGETLDGTLHLGEIYTYVVP